MRPSYSVPLLFFLLLATTFDSHARSARVNQIPNGNVLSCGACHTNASGGGPRNAFGQAIDNGFLNGLGGGATVNWNAQLAALDSDGDGASNGTELGDPDGDGNPEAGVTVTNPGDSTSFPQIPNRAPVLASIPAQSVQEGEALSFAVTATDEDGDTVTITASGLPAGATFTNNTFSWTPDFDDGGQVTISFAVSDGQLDSSASVTITVENVNRAPSVSAVDPQTVLEEEALTFTIPASDPDDDGLTVTSDNLPEGATLSGGMFAWTPEFDQGGQTFSVTFNVSDGDLDQSTSVEITVQDVNQPARIDAFEPSETLIVSGNGSSLSFSVVAVDPEDEALTFEWTLNGIVVESMTAMFDLEVLGERDDIVVVTVTSADGTSATQSWTITRGLKGDFNDDGRVEFGDFLAFAGAFNSTSDDADWDPVFDLSSDGRVDFTDFLTFAQFFGL